MSIKVSCISVIILINLFCSCKSQTDYILSEDDKINIQQKADSLAALQIDSAYKAIQQQCDTAKKYRLALLIDSILKNGNNK